MTAMAVQAISAVIDSNVFPEFLASSLGKIRRNLH
jgi:hypothetical protein